VQYNTQEDTCSANRLTVSAHTLGVVALPLGSVGTTNGVVGAVTLDSEASVLLASGGKAATLSVLVDRLADPVDAGVVLDGDVVRIDKDDFEVLVGGVLVDPVRVQDSQVGADTASTFLGDRAQVADELQLVDTLVLWLTVHNTLRVWSLAATAADGNTVHNVALLGLEAKAMGLVGAGRSSQSGDLVGLAVLPCSIMENIMLAINPINSYS
jgi:hypothetical protein